MSRMGNVYFHANMHCLRSRLPFFHSTLLQLQPGLYAFLLPAHKHAINLNFGLQYLEIGVLRIWHQQADQGQQFTLIKITGFHFQPRWQSHGFSCLFF